MGESIGDIRARRRRDMARLARDTEDAGRLDYRDAKRLASETLDRVGQNPKSRGMATSAARGAGNFVGAGRGLVHAIEGLAKAAAAVGPVAPYNALKDPRLNGHRRESEFDRLAAGAVNAAQRTVGYVNKGLADPRLVARDLSGHAQRWREELDPSATPAAPTFRGELRRNFDIGQNQGELVFNIGTLAVGGPLAKSVQGLGRASNIGNVERYLAQGFGREAAAHLAKPYPSRNMGHHFIPRSKKIPKSYGDSVFNVLKSTRHSRGDNYELHYEVDPSFHGTSSRGQSWSGKRLGLKRYGLVGRLWHGSPAPLKARIGGLGASAGAAINSAAGEGDR